MLAGVIPDRLILGRIFLVPLAAWVLSISADAALEMCPLIADLEREQSPVHAPAVFSCKICLAVRAGMCGARACRTSRRIICSSISAKLCLDVARQNAIFKHAFPSPPKRDERPGKRDERARRAGGARANGMFSTVRLHLQWVRKWSLRLCGRHDSTRQA